MRRYSTYLILFENGYLYADSTGAIHRRGREHSRGGGKPRLIWRQDFPTREQAVERERQIKGWSRAKKLALAAGDMDSVSQLARRRGGKALPEAFHRIVYSV